MMRLFALTFGISIALAHEHAFLMPNPALAGWQPVPLNQSFLHYPLPHMNGTIPSYLTGTLYRGAPGQWPDGWWLDALITINAFKFMPDGRVLYSMQYSQDESYNRTRHGVSSHVEAQSTEAQSTPGMPHPANSSFPTGVAFQMVDGHLLGSTGVSNMNEIDADTLMPISTPFQYQDELGAPFLSPTHTVMLNGSVLHHLTYGVQSGTFSKKGYMITEISKGSRSRAIIAKVEKPEASSWFGTPSYMHMTMATKRFYIMLESPCYYPTKITPVGEVDWKGFTWNALAGTHVRLVDRQTGKSSTWPLSHNLFAIHHINVYEDLATNTVVFDTIQVFPGFLPCNIAFKSLTMKNNVQDWEKGSKGRVGSTPLRLRIPLDKPGTKIVPQKLGRPGMEFPTIRYDDLNGKPYKYAFASWQLTKESAYYDAVGKLNVDTGELSLWSIPGHYPGEPIFVADPEGKDEDSGVLMTNVLDTHRNITYLLLLDAATMQEQARVGPTPNIIPLGYHGRYFDRKQQA